MDAIEEEGAAWPEEWLRTATLLRQDFEQYGIHLPVEEQAKVNELHDQLNYVQARSDPEHPSHPITKSATPRSSS